MPYLFYDYWYLIFCVPPLILALWASYNVNSTFKKYSTIYSLRHFTGYDSARMILDHNGLNNVKIERVAGNLTDHFDPKTNVIRLSDSVYSSNSVAAVGVAAHEAGHAVQHAKGYTPIKIRNSIFPVARFGSSAGIYLAMIGIILQMTSLAYVGVAFFLATVIFQLVTLPVEFNASRRAVDSLRTSGVLTEDELNASAKVLRAAALTYIAALAVSIGNLLRLLALIGGGRRRD